MFNAIAIRRREPIVLIATGNCEGFPSIVGFSKSSALPPPGDFISRFAHSEISKSVSTGAETRVNSPAASSAWINCRNELYDIGQASRVPGRTTRLSARLQFRKSDDSTCEQWSPGREK